MWQMLAWMQSDGACLFWHPEALWVGGVVVLVMVQWVKMDPPPAHSLSVSKAGKMGVNLCDITETNQSQHTGAGFPKCLLAKSSSFFFFNSNLKKWTLILNLWINFDHKAFWERQQSGSHGAGSRKSISQSDLAFTSFGPPLLLLDGRAFYTPNTEADTWTSHVRRYHRTWTDTNRNHVYMQTLQTAAVSSR